MSSQKNTGSSNVGLGLVAVLAIVVIGTVVYMRSGTPPAEPEAAAPAAGMAARPGAPAAGFGRDAAGTDGGSRLNAFSEVPAGSVRKELPADSARAPMAGRAEEKAAPVEDDPDDLPSLKRTALDDPDPERRLAAVTLLGISENPEAIPVLAEVLSDEDENVRMEAVLSLADFTDEAPVEALSQALSDPSPDVRYEALDALSDIETRDSKSAIQKALNDPDEDVRDLAEIILEMWDDDAE